MLLTFIIPAFLQVIVSPDADPPVVRAMDYKYDLFLWFFLKNDNVCLSPSIYIYSPPPPPHNFVWDGQGSLIGKSTLVWWFIFKILFSLNNLRITSVFLPYYIYCFKSVLMLFFYFFLSKYRYEQQKKKKGQQKKSAGEYLLLIQFSVSLFVLWSRVERIKTLTIFLLLNVSQSDGFEGA